jgi:NAD-dependent deacetylase
VKKKLVVLTGAGISAESGISTFRDSGGLWEGYDVTEVASPVGWRNNKELVLDFYNQRRRQILKAEPNSAHIALASLEDNFDVTIITQNIDDLHERGGSSHIIHLHGEIKKSRSTLDHNLIYDIEGSELALGDKCEKGSQLRPHIVWFGEDVPMIEEAIRYCFQADIFVVVGTSLVVYPAASLIEFVPSEAKKYIIDPNKPDIYYPPPNTVYIEKKATEGMKELIKILTK